MTELLARFPRQEDIKVGDFSLLFFIKRLTNVESFKTHVFRYCLAHCGFWKSLVFYENLHHTLISVVRSVAKYLKVSISRWLFIGLRTFSHANKTLGKLTREKVSSLNIYIVCSFKIYELRQIQVSNRSYQQNLFLYEISDYTVSKTCSPGSIAAL